MEDAIRLARQSIEQAAEGRPHAYAALGWFLLAAGYAGESEALLMSSIGRYPEHAPLHWYLGLVHLHARHPHEASQALLAAVTFDPKLDEAAMSLAWVLGDLGQFAEAEHYARQALAIKVQPDRLAQLGWLLLAQEKWQDAASQLNKALLQQPAKVETRGHLSTALQRLERNQEALTLLTDGLALTPGAPQLLQQRIHLLHDQHRNAEAREALEQLLRSAPDDATSDILAAIVLERSGDLQIASDHAEKAVARATQSAPAWRALAQVRTRQNRLAEATEALHTARDLDPHDTHTTNQLLGWVSITAHRFEDAAAAFTAALKNNADGAACWYGLAEANRCLGKFADALKAIENALVLRDGWLDALVLRGYILIEQGPESWNEAVLQLTQALSLQPDKVETRGHLSAALQRLDRDVEALQVLSDGLALTPEAKPLLQQRIHLLLRLRRTDDAHAACHELLTQRPLEGMGWYLLSLVLVQRKRRGVALRALARARRLAPELPELWQQTGWLALETGDLRFAREAAARALELAPEDAVSDILAAVVCESSGNFQASSEHAKKAITRAPRSAAAWRALAQVRVRQDRLEEAQTALHTALDLDPTEASSTYRQLGWVHIAEGKDEDAVAAFTAATRNDAQDAASWYGLAEAHRSAKQFVEALHAIHAALTLRREWPEAVYLRRRMVCEQINQLMKEYLLDFRVEHQPPLQLLPDPIDMQPATGQGAQYEYALCSFSTKSHLPLLRTLAASARKHFSGKVYLLLIDSDDVALLPEGTTPVRISDVIDPLVWQEMVQRYNILELCCTLKPFLMRYVARTAACPVVYLDADTYLLGSLSPALPEDPKFSVFLTPHLLQPFSGGRHVEEIGMLQVGIYNAGLVGVGVDRDALRFLDWWADRVHRYAYDAPEHGIFTDQKWIDLVPSFFQNIQISRDWGLNVGPWRIRSEQDFAEDPAGRLTFCGVPVKLMHVSRFNPNRPEMLTVYLPHAKTADSALGRFLRKYAREVIKNRRPKTATNPLDHE